MDPVTKGFVAECHSQGITDMGTISMLQKSAMQRMHKHQQAEIQKQANLKKMYQDAERYLGK